MGNIISPEALFIKFIVYLVNYNSEDENLMEKRKNVVDRIIRIHKSNQILHILYLIQVLRIEEFC